MSKDGNLFNLAEKQLKKEKEDGRIPCYTGLDVIEYAITTREWLDNNQEKIARGSRLGLIAKHKDKLSKEEQIKHHRIQQKRYMLNKRLNKLLK